MKFFALHFPKLTRNKVKGVKKGEEVKKNYFFGH